MNGWLIYSVADAKKNAGLIKIYGEESGKMKMNLSLIFSDYITIGIEEGALSIWYKGKKATLPDFVICRTIDISLTKQLEYLGVIVFNNSYVAEICNDKTSTYQLVADCGVLTVDSVFVDSTRINENSNHFSFPFVIKPTNGRSGQDVFLVKNETDYNEALLKMKHRACVIQKLSGRVGQDVRVYVLGKEIVAAILRKSEDDFRANFCLGGEASVYNLAEEEIHIVNKIINCFDFGLVGIDFLFDASGGLLFNEIEDVVGARALYAKTDINIAKRYLEFISGRIRNE